jgi:tetratricopeptide (TPR) repeat protein
VTCTALANPLSAIEAFENAIRIKQNYAQARVNLALSYLMIRKPALALEQYRVLKDLDRERADKLLGLINSNK